MTAPMIGLMAGVDVPPFATVVFAAHLRLITDLAFFQHVDPSTVRTIMAEPDGLMFLLQHNDHRVRLAAQMEVANG